MLNNLKATYFCILPAVVLMSSASFSALAKEEKPNLSLSLGVQQDDNVFRTETNAESDTKIYLSGVAGYKTVGNWYQLNLTYSASQNDYLDNAYQDQRVVNGQGKLVVGQPGHWFSWVFSDAEQTTVVDVLSPDTPNNRSQRSVYSTGPQLNLNVSSADRFSASYMFTKVNVADSSADSTSKTATAGYLRRLSKTMKATLNLSRTEVEPEVDALFFLDGDNQYQQDRASLSINRTIKDGSLALTYGTSKLNGLKDISTGSSEEYSLSARRLFAFGTLDLSYAKSVSDSGIGQIQELINNPLGQQTFDIQENKLWQFGYTSPSLPGRMTVSLTSSRSQVDLITREASEQRDNHTVTVNHRLTEHTKLSGTFNQQTNTFDDNSKSKMHSISIGINHQVSQKLSLGCSASDESGSGDRRYDVLLVNCSANWRIY